KILYLITQSELGGAQSYIFDLAKNLKEEYEISVAFGLSRNRRGEPGEAGELAKALKSEEISAFFLPHLKRRICPRNDLWAYFEIKALIKKLEPDIIHLNSSKISILGSLAARAVKSKKTQIIYTAHGWVFNEPMSGIKKAFYKWAEKFTARYKDKIICVSEFDRQAALKEEIAPAEKLVTIHNGIGEINFLTKEDARQKLNLPPDSLVIGSIGNLYKTKGFEYFIEAAASLLKSQLSGQTKAQAGQTARSPLAFIIIGEGGERKNLEALINKHHLEKQFILAGRISDASRLLKAFDVYVSSSVKEGLSYTLIEAVQAGLPIVATEVGGNPEVLAGYSADLVEPGDSQALAEKISRHLGRPFPIKKIPQGFTLREMLEKTKKIYASSF
ncbi:MAG: glycosyltransferase, partial [Patescibacteria group bacterium]